MFRCCNCTNADINIRRQRKSSEAPGEWQASGTASCSSRRAAKFSFFLFSCQWRWDCPSSSYYLFNRMRIQLKALRILITSLRNTKVSLSSVSIHMGNWFLILLAATTHSRPVEEMANQGRCFDDVIIMFKSVDVNVRPQLEGHPSPFEGPDERQAPGTDAYGRECLVDSERIPTTNFGCWRWDYSFSWTITCLIKHAPAKGPGNPSQKSQHKGKTSVVYHPFIRIIDFIY